LRYAQDFRASIYSNISTAKAPAPS
jgi:hypothetical protein